MSLPESFDVFVAGARYRVDRVSGPRAGRDGGPEFWRIMRDLRVVAHVRVENGETMHELRARMTRHIEALGSMEST